MLTKIPKTAVMPIIDSLESKKTIEIYPINVSSPITRRNLGGEDVHSYLCLEEQSFY